VQQKGCSFSPLGPPAPIKEAGFRVLILEEIADRSKLPRPQNAAINSTVMRGYMNGKCVKGADGKTPEWRDWDDDFTAEQLANESQLWRDAYARAKQDSAGKLPWLLVSNGKTGASVPFPATEAEVMTLLKKYGGE
jgi:hypothetical protein